MGAGPSTSHRAGGGAGGGVDEQETREDIELKQAIRASQLEFEAERVSLWIF